MVGVSSDNMKAQRRFVERLELDFPMLCDTEGEMLRAYGVRGLLGFAKRASFLIDAEGKIVKIYEKVSTSKHAAQVLEDLALLAQA